MGVIVVVIGTLLLANGAAFRSIPGSQRRQYQTVWLSNLVASFLVVFVVARTSRLDHPADLLVSSRSWWCSPGRRCWPTRPSPG